MKIIKSSRYWTLQCMELQKMSKQSTIQWHWGRKGPLNQATKAVNTRFLRIWQMRLLCQRDSMYILSFLFMFSLVSFCTTILVRESMTAHGGIERNSRHNTGSCSSSSSWTRISPFSPPADSTVLQIPKDPIRQQPHLQTSSQLMSLTCSVCFSLCFPLIVFTILWFSLKNAVSPCCCRRNSSEWNNPSQWLSRLCPSHANSSNYDPVAFFVSADSSNLP